MRMIYPLLYTTFYMIDAHAAEPKPLVHEHVSSDISLLAGMIEIGFVLAGAFCLLFSIIKFIRCWHNPSRKDSPLVAIFLFVAGLILIYLPYVQIPIIPGGKSNREQVKIEKSEKSLGSKDE